ncbi:MAG: glycosyltransferase family 4 protein [Bacteroidota bacterium]
MKIAQVCPYDLSRPGGVKNHIICLSNELESLGHEVQIIAPSGEQKQVDHRIHLFGRNRSLKISGTKIDLNIALKDEKKALKDYLKSQHFDIIHYHTFWNPVLPFQVWKHSKAKNIATFHDTPKHIWLGKTVMPLTASMIFKMMDKVISVSASQASHIGGKNVKLQIIPNGIDLETYLKPIKKAEASDNEKFTLLFLGRLEPRKGIIYALKSYLELKKEYNQLKLIIAGDGQEKELITSFVKEHELNDVEVLGQVSDEMKLSLMRKADLYLGPAIHGESFGIVLLEAMASGLPMVGFGNEGYLNIIPEQWREFFPEPKNQGAFTRAIQRMINEKSLRDKMIKWGHNEVRKYDWKKVVKEIESIYLDALM